MGKRNPLIDKICLDMCDGYDSRCQRYPLIAESCEDFLKFKTGYETGIKCYYAMKPVYEELVKVCHCLELYDQKHNPTLNLNEALMKAKLCLSRVEQLEKELGK